MTPSELEIWSRKLVEAALQGNTVEDSRVELKANWVTPDKAADRLAGHANAARGNNILWVFGIDENKRRLMSIDPNEKGNWYRAVEARFDGFAPRLLLDINFEMDGSSLASMYFDTSHEPPFVIKGKTGGYPEYLVPWRIGTSIRAASRAQLLSLLVPLRTLTELKSETEFNKKVAGGPYGGMFRTEQFSHALSAGVLDDVPREIRDEILSTYAKIEFCNQKTAGYHQFSGNWGARGFLEEEGKRVFEAARSD